MQPLLKYRIFRQGGHMRSASYHACHKRACFKSRQVGRLAEAADLMEEAFNKSPELRQKYAHQVKLWRCGISM